ncbi:hypothetical protein GCM10010528_09520 [Gordonia defluvii]|jgi:uncharacterized protein YcnI|uniref:YncI copper-binding domain-containing protein n=1 Tax=Gordonia defluvii TaxID=283718 RepID=A0ABP6L6J2_9ACTN|nr:YcnI family protein [Gordonia sp. UBA5067]
MTITSARLTRTALAISVAAGLALVPIVGAGVADAHVVARTAGMGANGFGVVTFMVPNESDTAATTGFTVAFPGVKHLLPESKPGWVSQVTKNADGAVTEIRWAAAPGTPGIPVDQFAEFSVAGGPFAGEVVLPAVQRYADGTTAAWDQRSTAGADEPEHPAPTINAAPPVAAAATDHPARWLGGLGLLAGAAGVAIGAAAARGRKSAPNDENRLEEENGHA